MEIDYSLVRIGNGDYKTLECARNFLDKHLGNFPINKCQHASRFLNLTFGLEEIAGEYLGIPEEPQFHTWNYDKKLNLYIDLTLKQFNFRYKSIEILPIENFFIKKTDKNTKRHIDYANKFLNEELRELVTEFKFRMNKYTI